MNQEERNKLFADPPPFKWLEVPVPDERPKVHMSMRGNALHSRGECTTTLSGLTEKEMQAVERMLAGDAWIGIECGRIQVIPKHDPLPETEPDPSLPDSFMLRPDDAVEMKVTIEHSEKEQSTYSPSITIHALGAGTRSRRERLQNEKLAESFGFNCMRSPRGSDGKFWELWYLPGLWISRGRFREYLEAEGLLSSFDPGKWIDNTRRATHYLARSLMFGSLDVTVQRWALAYD